MYKNVNKEIFGDRNTRIQKLENYLYFIYKRNKFKSYLT